MKCRVRDWNGDWTSEVQSESGMPVGEANIGVRPEPDLTGTSGTRQGRSIMVLERNTGHGDEHPACMVPQTAR
ncbi:hypothetical protein [Paenibacillus apis]|uniref:hypothetical protein n=1 Tax=Paenibacillus apis TaxID=1792174 RepID=UPI0026595A03|nr:hypothetical protein [Paenibacillus apis]